MGPRSTTPVGWRRLASLTGTHNPMHPTAAPRPLMPTGAGWGRFVYRFRWSVLIASILSLGAAIGLVTLGVTFQAPSTPTTIESGKGLTLIEAELPARPTSFSLIFSHPTWQATDPEFKTEVGPGAGGRAGIRASRES